MPEGPSIVILKEAVRAFTGKKVIAVTGNSKIDQQRLLNEKVVAFKSWGKHFLVCFKHFSLRVHFLLFGSYLVNEQKDRPVRLALIFPNGELNLYACAIRIVEEDLDEIYDWSSDVMNEQWDEQKALTKIKKQPGAQVCDVLLNQEIFSGVGNIIKNEVLYRTRIHPESLVGKIPPAKIKLLIREARNYSFDFLEWKKQFVLKKHWLAHTKKICRQCGGPILKTITGSSKRRSFFCEHCQKYFH
jgi:endonuclease-8